MILGISGGIGSGKSSLAILLSEQDTTIIDTDNLAQECFTTQQQQIDQQFCTLDRAKIRKIVFTDEGQRQALENIIHPCVAKELHAQLAVINEQHCILVSALLFSTEQYTLCDKTLWVNASKQQRIARVCQRDNCTIEEVESIIDTQQDFSYLADRIIENTGDMEKLRPLKLTDFMG